MDDFLMARSFPEWEILGHKEAIYGVIRRDSRSDKNLIPIGLRGVERGQRCGGWIRDEAIKEIITPESLVSTLNWKTRRTEFIPKVITSLINATSIFQDTGLRWGPTGSTGFELATGIKSIKDTSDLDLVVYAGEKMSVEAARDLLTLLEKTSACRLDIQLETPRGGISMKEYATSRNVLLKSDAGPFLVDRTTLWNNLK